MHLQINSLSDYAEFEVNNFCGILYEFFCNLQASAF